MIYLPGQKDCGTLSQLDEDQDKPWREEVAA